MLQTIVLKLPEFILLIYAGTIMLYFIDFIDKNRIVNKIAFRFLSIVWLLQTIFLFLYMFQIGRFPILTLFEGLYFYTWILITLSLVIHKIYQVDFTVFFTNIVGFTMMAIHAFAPIQKPTTLIAEQLMSELLVIHITLAILSYGAFTASFVFSMMYVLQYRLLKQKKWKQRLWRFSDLGKLEKLIYRFQIIGIPILLLSLILGLQWGIIKLPNLLLYDPKIIGSFLLLIIYGMISYLYKKGSLYGIHMAFWNMIAFLIILINFFLISRLSLFHIWE